MAEKIFNNTNITVEFEEPANRQTLISGENTKSLFGKTSKWLRDLKAVAFSGSYNDLSDTPEVVEVDGTTLKTDDEGKAYVDVNEIKLPQYITYEFDWTSSVISVVWIARMPLNATTAEFEQFSQGATFLITSFGNRPLSPMGTYIAQVSGSYENTDMKNQSLIEFYPVRRNSLTAINDVMIYYDYNNWRYYGIRRGGWERPLAVTVISSHARGRGVEFMPTEVPSSYAGFVSITPIVLSHSDHTHTVVNGHTVLSDVPANAVFTDTTYSDATETTAGLMGIGEQTFGGNKYFTGTVQRLGANTNYTTYQMRNIAAGTTTTPPTNATYGGSGAIYLYYTT